MKTGALSSENIETCIASLKKKIGGDGREVSGLILPITYKGEIDRTKYQGIGRPKDSDYKREYFPWSEHMRIK